jgi:hypothetical protein
MQCRAGNGGGGAVTYFKYTKHYMLGPGMCAKAVYRSKPLYTYISIIRIPLQVDRPVAQAASAVTCT